ncbi:hypothetical protein [Rhizobium leguminosarum]|uniref:hypothetical protein n=1 Tax=Rhizobium leguminosarum TaxID=384 RepID=UPI0021BBDB35|nr:hypothetical protein [Rhizobium leguminosarum]
MTTAEISRALQLHRFISFLGNCASGMVIFPRLVKLVLSQQIDDLPSIRLDTEGASIASQLTGCASTIEPFALAEPERILTDKISTPDLPAGDYPFIERHYPLQSWR